MTIWTRKRLRVKLDFRRNIRTHPLYNATKRVLIELLKLLVENVGVLETELGWLNSTTDYFTGMRMTRSLI